MSSSRELTRKIDALASDMSDLMASAFSVLRDCEGKLRDFKLNRHAQDSEATALLGAEIISLLSSTADIYRQASGKARTARTAFNSLVAQAHQSECSDTDANVFMSACRRTGQALEAFEKLIAELERLMEWDLEVFRSTSSASEVTPQAANAFRLLMRRVMGAHQDRSA